MACVICQYSQSLPCNLCSKCSQSCTLPIASLQSMLSATNWGTTLWTHAGLRRSTALGYDVWMTVDTLIPVSLICEAWTCQAWYFTDKRFHHCFQLQDIHIRISLYRYSQWLWGRCSEQFEQVRHCCLLMQKRCCHVQMLSIIIAVNNRVGNTHATPCQLRGDAAKRKGLRQHGVHCRCTSLFMSIGASTSLCRLAKPAWGKPRQLPWLSPMCFQMLVSEHLSRLLLLVSTGAAEQLLSACWPQRICLSGDQYICQVTHGAMRMAKRSGTASHLRLLLLCQSCSMSACVN